MSDVEIEALLLQSFKKCGLIADKVVLLKNASGETEAIALMRPPDEMAELHEDTVDELPPGELHERQYDLKKSEENRFADTIFV